MNKKPFIIMLFACLLLFWQDLKAQTVHLIFVADTINNTGFSTTTDIKRVQRELKVAAQAAKIPVKEKVFAGRTFNKNQVVSYLQNLQVDSSDVVVFYFSGHGYRNKQKKTSWPYLNFNFAEPGVDLQWVADVIRHKNARFAFVAADCCNNFVEDDWKYSTESKSIPLNLPHLNPRTEGYGKLLLNGRGCLVACSSNEGQFSFGSEIGSIFTQALTASIQKETLESAPNWKRVLDSTAAYIKHVQKPVYQLYH